MATGYLFKALANQHILTTNPVNVVSVPTGHIYLLKGLHCAAKSSSSGAAATRFNFELSDTAGANFRQVTSTYGTIALDNKTAFANPATPGPGSGGGNFSDNVAENDNTLWDLVMEAGQILRCVPTLMGTGGFIDVRASVADYTI